MVKEELRRLTWALVLISIGYLTIGSDVRAGSITYSGSGPGSGGGAVSASITFKAITGGIDITITNDASGTITRSQAVSGVLFTVGGGLSTPSAFYKMSGNSVDSADFTAGHSFPGSATVTPFSDTGSGTIDHWGFSTSSASVTLTSAGSGAPGGNPIYLVLPSSGTAGSGKSLADGHFDPYILGPGNFFLTVAGVTDSTSLSSANFSDVMIRFGTNPDSVVSASAVPEPSSLVLSAFGVLGTVMLVRSRRRQPA